jgi:hypothetical protein
MRVCGRMRIRCQQVKRIVQSEEEGDDERLRDFDAIDASEDVDAIWAKDGHGGHVKVVEESEVEELPKVWLEGGRDHDLGDPEIDKVDDQQGDAGECWDEEFVPPPDVEQVVANAEDGDGLEGEDCGEVGC